MSLAAVVNFERERTVEMKNARLRLRIVALALLACSVTGAANASPFEGNTRAFSDPIESEQGSNSLLYDDFSRKTGAHFSGTGSKFADTIYSRRPTLEHAQYVEEGGHYYSRRSDCESGCRGSHECENDYQRYPRRKYHEDTSTRYEGYYEDEYIETEECK